MRTVPEFVIERVPGGAGWRGANSGSSDHRRIQALPPCHGDAFNIVYEARP